MIAWPEKNGRRVHLGTQDTVIEDFPLWIKEGALTPFHLGAKQLGLVTSFPGNLSALLQEVFPEQVHIPDELGITDRDHQPGDCPLVAHWGPWEP